MEIDITDDYNGDILIRVRVSRYYQETKTEPIPDFPRHLMTPEQQLGIITDSVLTALGVREIK